MASQSLLVSLPSDDSLQIPECVPANLNIALIAIRSNTPEGLNCDNVTLITEVRRTEWSADFSVHTSQFPPPDIANQQRAKTMLQKELGPRGRITTCDVITVSIPSGLITKWRVGYLPPDKDVPSSDEDFNYVVNEIPPTPDDRKKARLFRNRMEKGKLYRTRDGSVHKSEEKTRHKTFHTMTFYNSKIDPGFDPAPTKSQKNQFFAWLRKYCKGMKKQIVECAAGIRSVRDQPNRGHDAKFKIQPFISGGFLEKRSSHSLDQSSRRESVPTLFDDIPRDATSRATISTVDTEQVEDKPAIGNIINEDTILIGRLSRDPLIPAALHDIVTCPCKYSSNVNFNERDSGRRAASMMIIDKAGLNTYTDKFEVLLSGLMARSGLTTRRLMTMPLSATNRGTVNGSAAHLYCHQSKYSG